MTATSDLLEQALQRRLSGQSKALSDPHRPAWHLAAPVGLLNDPNGFIQHAGRYHLFYQWNPFACAHGAKFWGHVSSVDLVHWRDEPPALAPSESYERNGCYSGSAVAGDDKLILIYTGNVKRDDGSRTAYQCLAVDAGEGRFQKLGPVMDVPPGYTGHVRDPKVWRQDDAWYMVLGAQTESLKGRVLLYRSADLYQWTLQRELAGSELGGLGPFGYMWECPDFFALGERHVLIACPQGLPPEPDRYLNKYQCGWLAGAFDIESARFKHGAFHELDLGFDFYAPQTTLDAQGRRLMFGWLGLPDDNEAHHPTIAYGWLHQMSCPRELYWQGEQLCQRPAVEIQRLRGELTLFAGPAARAPALSAASAWVDLTVSGEGGLTLGQAARLEWSASSIRLSRLNWRTQAWEHRDAPLRRGRLTLLLDHSSLECFVDDGQRALSARYFPGPAPRLSFQGTGEIRVEHWPLGDCESRPTVQ